MKPEVRSSSLQLREAPGSAATARRGGLWWVLLPVVYLVGVFGLHSLWRAYFLLVTPVLLALEAALLVGLHTPADRKHWLFWTVAALAGFGIELLGVHTGFPFGEYAYGPVFGLSVAGVPLLIGLNWLTLTYITGAATQKIRPLLARAIAAATLMALIDVLMEPVAIALDYWHWEAGTPPLRNYLGWWVFSFGLHLAARGLGIRYQPRLALPLLAGQLLFFLLLNLWPA